MNTQYQIPQTPPPSQPTNQLLNTNPASMMHPDKAMASLAFSTHLLNQLLQHHAPEQQTQTPSQSPQDAPGEEEKAEPKDNQSQEPDETDAKMNKLELDMSKKFDDLRKELDEKHKLELDNLRNDIKSALDAEEQNEQS